MKAGVIDINDDYAVLDMNHPLTGQDLKFKSTFLDIKMSSLSMRNSLIFMLRWDN